MTKVLKSPARPRPGDTPHRQALPSGLPTAPCCEDESNPEAGASTLIQCPGDPGSSGRAALGLDQMPARPPLATGVCEHHSRSDCLSQMGQDMRPLLLSWAVQAPGQGGAAEGKLFPPDGQAARQAQAPPKAAVKHKALFVSRSWPCSLASPHKHPWK